MPRNKLVSVIMPAYNAESYIEESIQSVLRQTYKHLELIVIDDCSSDNTRLIVDKYITQDDRVKLISNAANKKVAYSRNAGIQKACGEYIAFLDSDDIWLSEKLSVQISEMERKGYLVSHGSYYRIDKFGKKIGKVCSESVVSYKDMLKGNKIGNLTGIYNASVIGKVFQNNIGHEDYKMWLEILSSHDSIGIKEPIGSYRVLDGSVSSNKLKAVRWHYNIVNEALLGNKIKSFYFTSIYLFNAALKRL